MEKPKSIPDITSSRKKLSYHKHGPSFPKKVKTKPIPEKNWTEEDEKAFEREIEKAYKDDPKKILNQPRPQKDKEFKKTCRSALNEIKESNIEVVFLSEKIDPETKKNIEINSTYGEKITELINALGEQKLLAFMNAVARKESGEGGQIGSKSLYYWESKHQTYSAGYFHVLVGSSANSEGKKIKHPGQRALENLKLEIKDLTKPKNSAKLFLAYLVEKWVDYSANENVQREDKNYLINRFKSGNIDPNGPKQPGFENFARFHNGKGAEEEYWRELSKYYVLAQNISEKQSEKKSKWNFDSRSATEAAMQKIMPQLKYAELSDVIFVKKKDEHEFEICIQRKGKEYTAKIPTLQGEIRKGFGNCHNNKVLERIKKNDPNLSICKQKIKDFLDKKSPNENYMFPDDSIEFFWSTKVKEGRPAIYFIRNGEKYPIKLGL